MWYRQAQQGIMNLDKRLVPGAEQAITEWLQSQVTLLPAEPGETYNPKGYFEFENVSIPPYLKQYISNISHDLREGASGTYNSQTKTLKLPKRVPYEQLNNLIGITLHEIRHSVDPRYTNSKYMQKVDNEFAIPQRMQDEILYSFRKEGKVITYDEMIHKMAANAGLDANDPRVKNVAQKSFPESSYNIALKSIFNGNNLYLNNPIELPSQLGDVRNLLNKNVLDSVKQKYYPQSTPEQWKEYLKNSLSKPGSQEFENLSNQIQEVSGNQGNTISTIVKGTKDPKWQRQYLNQVSNSVNQYQVPQNAFKNFSGAINQYQAPNKAVGQVPDAIGQVPNKAVNQVTNALDNLQIPSNAITNFVKKTLT